MSTYDIIHPTYYVVRLLEGVAQLFSITLAPCQRPGHMGWAFPMVSSCFRTRNQRSRVRKLSLYCVQPCWKWLWLLPTCTASWPINCVWAWQGRSGCHWAIFLRHTWGWKNGCCMCNGTYPLKTGVAVTTTGVFMRADLVEWAGMGSERWSVHKECSWTNIHCWSGCGCGWWGTSFQVQATFSVTNHQCAELRKEWQKLELLEQSMARRQRHAPADLQPSKHDVEYILVWYYIIYDILYDIAYFISCTMS